MLTNLLSTKVPSLGNPTPLTIKVLFCYSKEVLMNTYMSVENKIIQDNTSLCAYTKGIFNMNVTNYTVDVLNVCTIQVNDLQNSPISFTYSEGSEQLLKDYVNGKYPVINNLKNQYNATVVVFETFFVSSVQSLTGLSYTIGISNANEACLCICRSSKAFLKLNIELSPIILSHELGHLMGCRHSLEESETFEQKYAGSYGHAILKDPKLPYDKQTNPAEYGDIMSYANNVVLYYSNPNHFPYPSSHQNIAGGVEGVSEAYKVVENNIPKLAGIFPP